MNKMKLINLAIASFVTVGLSVTTTQVQAAKKQPMEQCYGIAKKGKNDCGTKTHACSGMAKTNNDPTEWVFVPKGSCEKMGGTLKPGAAKDPSTKS